MARSDILRREIAGLESKGAGLTKDLAKHQEAANKASVVATRKRSEATKTKSDSIRRTATSAAEREEQKAANALKKVSDVQSKIAINNKSINSKRTSLSAALRDEQRASDREESRRQQKAKSESQRHDRDEAKRRQTEKQHAREVNRLSSPPTTIRYIEVHPPKPEMLRVLYLTANPESVEVTKQLSDGTLETTGVWLRVEVESRIVV